MIEEVCFYIEEDQTGNLFENNFIPAMPGDGDIVKIFGSDDQLPAFIGFVSSICWDFSKNDPFSNAIAIILKKTDRDVDRVNFHRELRGSILYRGEAAENWGPFMNNPDLFPMYFYQSNHYEVELGMTPVDAAPRIGEYIKFTNSKTGQVQKGRVDEMTWFLFETETEPWACELAVVLTEVEPVGS
jgi:hypothetical protein